MSDVETDSKTRIHKLPFVIKKDSIKSGPHSLGLSFRCFSNVKGNVIKEDIIYKSKAGDFFNGKYPDLCIINRLDLTQNVSRTIASYTDTNSATVKVTSDAVVKLIGQANYDQVFVSLCCVINQELKVKGILSLLCAHEDKEKEYSTVATQTYESSYSDLIKEKKRKSVKLQSRRNKVRPYVVKLQESNVNTVKKVVIHPNNFRNIEDLAVDADTEKEAVPISDESCNGIKLENISIDSGHSSCTDNYLKPCGTDNDSFPELKEIVNEDSNISDADSIGNLSISSSINLIDIENKAKAILNYIDDHTELNKLDYDEGVKSTIVMTDGSKVTIRGNPDVFHIAMPDILKDLSPMDQKKILFHQAYLDWKYCLEPNEDKNFPIHLAVLNNDLDLLRRQCLVLKCRHESVDILAAGDLTALQIAIFQDSPECTALLLAHGADVLVRDDESRTPLHLAAETGVKHVQAILTHCRNNARKILKENEDIWKPELENKPDDKLGDYLLTQMSTMCDNQGYTPLMLASKVGNAEVVEALVAAAPSTINMAMPTCGNTALYLAAGATCMEAANRGNKTNLAENYKRTVEILLTNGADLAIDNHSGSNVSALLSELQDVTLSAFISSRVAVHNGYRAGNYMLLKDENGAINMCEMKKRVYTKRIEDKVNSKNDKANVNTNAIEKSNIEDKATSNNTNHTANIATKSKSNENDDKNKSSKKTDKPMILKNFPVITKIVSLSKNKPILIKGILPKDGSANEGLKTKITAKSNVSKISLQPLDSNAHMFVKILPKVELDTPNSKITPISVPLPEPTADPSISALPTKKKPIILRQAAVKRSKHDNDDSEPTASSNKKLKP